MADPPSYPGAPRWVKVSGIIALVLFLLIVILLVGGGAPNRHGPGRHMAGSDESSSNDAKERTTITDDAIVQPAPKPDQQ